MDLTDRRCVVVGGGEVAERKVAALLDAGARVCVVSPSLSARLGALVRADAIEHRARAWQLGDLEDCAMAFAATDDPETHRAIVEEARALRVPINVADEPDLCDFIVPSVLHRGDLQVAVSTSGASPALAARVRREIGALLGPEYEIVTRVMRAARSYLREREPDSRRRGEILRALAFSEIVERVRDNDWRGVDRLLVAGLGVGLATLGIQLPDRPEIHRLA